MVNGVRYGWVVLVACAAGFQTGSLERADGVRRHRDKAVLVAEPKSGLIRDNNGRSYLFHGQNFVQKFPPYVPKINKTLLRYLQVTGGNVVRVGVMSAGLFPTADWKADAGYLNKLREVVDILYEHGISTILDLHQDALSRKICGFDGLPDWMVNVSELNAMNVPLPLQGPNTYVADPKTGAYTDLNCSYFEPYYSRFGWAMYYLTDAVGKAFQQIYDMDSETTLGQLGMEAWAAISKHFRDHPGVIAYEMLNEPWPGDTIKNPNILVQGTADLENLVPFFQAVEKTIRKYDNKTLVMYETSPFMQQMGHETSFSPGFLPGTSTLFAYHIYCPQGTDGPGPTTPEMLKYCIWNTTNQMDIYQRNVERVGTVGFVTEFGSMEDSNNTDTLFRSILTALDSRLTSWIYWDANFIETDPNWEHSVNHSADSVMKEFASTYPQITAGTLKDFQFDRDTGIFNMSYITDAKVAKTTVFASKAFYYPSGRDIKFQPKNCCRILETSEDKVIFRHRARYNGQSVPIQVIISPKARTSLLSTTIQAYLTQINN
mmetsp:Transcript_40424/g.65142  ORF Transcript_40424/g.65142 Transcript_40424/m.65142 type:complete len:545 (+) Transcript_40424:244-1878(+)